MALKTLKAKNKFHFRTDHFTRLHSNLSSCQKPGTETSHHALTSPWSGPIENSTNGLQGQ